MASVAGLRERYLTEFKSFRAETKGDSFPKLQEEKKCYRTIFRELIWFYNIDLTWFQSSCTHMASVAGLWERYLAESKSFSAETKGVSFPKQREEKKCYRNIFRELIWFYSLDLTWFQSSYVCVTPVAGLWEGYLAESKSFRAERG